MKTAVVGSRIFADYNKLAAYLDTIKDKITLIVSGGAKGADSLGERWAYKNSIPTLIFKPDWSKYGKGAGFIRNEDIVKNSDMILAFWDGKSKGTEHTINLAKQYNKPVHIVHI